MSKAKMWSRDRFERANATFTRILTATKVYYLQWQGVRKIVLKSVGNCKNSFNYLDD